MRALAGLCLVAWAITTAAAMWLLLAAPRFLTDRDTTVPIGTHQETGP